MALKVIGVNINDILLESVLECRSAASLSARRCQLENGRRLEHAITGHESPYTTKLYDRTKDEITLE